MKPESIRAARTIPPRPQGANVPLSFAQRRLWFLHQLIPDENFYNICSAVRLTGHLDLGALADTLGEIERRHEVLRTSFVAVGGSPAQTVHQPGCVRLLMVDLRDLPRERREAAAKVLLAEAADRPFDLTEVPLARVVVFKLEEDSHVVLLAMHHIICDAWSMELLLREVTLLYEAYATGKPSPLPDLPVQYADYACWQEKRLEEGLMNKQLSYWKGRLAGAQTRLNLPADRPRPEAQTYKGMKEAFLLPPDLHRSLRVLSRAERVTLFMTLLTAFNVLLHRSTEQEDILVGTPVAGRNQLETECLIGLFINNIVLRTDLSGNPKFKELLQRVSRDTWAAYANQDLPFEKLVEELQPDRRLSHTPLFQVAFGLQNVPNHELELPGLKLSPVEFQQEVARFDLTLWMRETEQGLEGVWTYSTELFDASTIRRMTGHYRRLLEGVVAEPEARIKSLEMSTQEEQAQQKQWEEASAKRLIVAKRKRVSLTGNQG
jgi:hypothetical protein